MSEVLDRFLRYVSYDTQSKEEEEAIPSTSSQLALAKLLRMSSPRWELPRCGWTNTAMCMPKFYQTPAGPSRRWALSPIWIPSPALSGRDVKPQLVKNYDGGDICLNHDLGIVLSPADFPELLEYKGQTLVTTDGTTLLGADDKAGAAGDYVHGGLASRPPRKGARRHLHRLHAGRGGWPGRRPL